MSKLEDIILGDTPRLFFSDSMLEKPQKVRDLVLELIGEELKVKVPYDLVELQKAFENGHNMFRKQLIKKVKTL